MSIFQDNQRIAYCLGQSLMWFKNIPVQLHLHRMPNAHQTTVHRSDGVLTSEAAAGPTGNHAVVDVPNWLAYKNGICKVHTTRALALRQTGLQCCVAVDKCIPCSDSL